MTDSKPTRTKPIEGDPDGHNDLRVVWNHDHTKILVDRRKKD